MLNAHRRFGWLNFVKATEHRTSSFRVRLDRFIAEPAANRNELAKAHLVSVMGGDTQIAAIAAALSDAGRFTIEGPDIESCGLQMSEAKPQTYRATLQLRGRNRPIRHLIAMSQELASPMMVRQVVLADSHPEFVWSALAKMLGLPGMPDWAEWFHDQLTARNAIRPLLGIGCSPVLIKGSREEFLSWLGGGIRSGTLSLPAENRAIHWPRFGLDHILNPPEVEDPPAPGSVLPV